MNTPTTARTILFASPHETTPDYSEMDGPTTNLPLLSALVEHSVPGVGTLYVVFDGCFLTAARLPRYSEVRELLDQATTAANVFFAQERAPFTGGLSAEDATKKLLEVGPLQELTDETRPTYFRMLSLMPEAEIAKL